MHIMPNLDEYLELAGAYPVVPVTLTQLADRETPVSAFEKLVGDAPGFLLESVEGGERWAQWSFLGWDPVFTLTSRDGECTAEGIDIELGEGDPLAVLERLIKRFASPEITIPDVETLPPLHSGAVGYLSYDAVRYIEWLPNRPTDDRGLPEMLWHFVGSLAAFDRFSHTVTLVRNVFIEFADDLEQAYADAVVALQSASQDLVAPSGYRPTAPPHRNPDDVIVPSSTVDQPTFEASVEKVKKYILEGDAFQVVLSQRLEIPYEDDPFSVYRALRLINPSPFLFYICHPEVTVVGSSPELMTRIRDGSVFSRPIAGTRPRGTSEDEDLANAEDLLADPKERAEHVMLIDLARNDLGRVCKYGSVHVDDLMVIERYSHVMHIVSGVSGKLAADVGPVDVIRAVFPHGTVSGAPKVRAMEIIDELEPVARGPYAGAAGYLDFSGNVDTAICLRMVVVADGKAWVQAGAGLVFDSDPTAEYNETMDKAAAALAAIHGARSV